MRDDPYRSPAGPPAAAATRGGGASALLIATGVAVSGLVALLVQGVVPGFAGTFEVFGVELPQISQWLLRWHGLAWGLPPAVLLVALAWPQPRQRAWLAFGLGVGGGLLVAGLVFAALYVPMRMLSSVV
jgi:hypothetical protein